MIRPLHPCLRERDQRCLDCGTWDTYGPAFLPVLVLLCWTCLWRRIVRVAAARDALPYAGTTRELTREPHQKNERGLTGEAAVARRYGEPFRLYSYARGGDGNIDFWLPGGVTLDAKATTPKWRHEIQVPADQPLEKIKADVIVSVVIPVDGERGEVVGWCPRQAVLDAPIQTKGRRIPTRVVTHVRPIGDLDALLHAACFSLPA